MPINSCGLAFSWSASQRAQYRWRGQQPHCTLRLDVLEPKELAGRLIAGHVYAQPKALWKLFGFSGNDTMRVEPISNTAGNRCSSGIQTGGKNCSAAHYGWTG
jgi:hypothetical protein